MFIYKITNKINNKIYIGQVYNKTIYDRFKRHCKEASKTSKSYIDRAINKYGEENFIVEEIDKANSIDELNQKEIYWINFYNSTNHNIGYNLTKGGDGGNTYLCKTPEELQEIKNKISKANSGKNNAMSKQIKALNTVTNEIYHFDTLHEVLTFLNISHKENVTHICTGKCNYLYKGIWNFVYENDEFRHLMIKPKRTHFGIRKCFLLNKITNVKIEYVSNTEARKHSNLGPREKENNTWKIIDNI